MSACHLTGPSLAIPVLARVLALAQGRNRVQVGFELHACDCWRNFPTKCEQHNSGSREGLSEDSHQPSSESVTLNQTVSMERQAAWMQHGRNMAITAYKLRLFAGEKESSLFVHGLGGRDSISRQQPLPNTATKPR
ncbi:hypothetical protein N658DRAFT_302628 [Parathielavia hyrcaniae]|uniref:Uncharacterized protein n=1 Tax=Parathielavia hyrcaniae TaxID=113614 RepID=A0AAN6Q425_9PEZI|nr:hypothetical protein N658DRAFT_302628 [Parathielavia hyrcaniae]